MTPRWTYVDFVLVVLGGVAGVLVASSASLLFSMSESTLVFVGLAGQVVGHLVVLWLIGRTRHLGFESLGFDLRPSDGLYVGLGIVLQVAVALLFEPLRQLLVPENQSSQELIRIFDELDSPAAGVVMVTVTTFLAPLVEELMFRGVLLKAMHGRSRIAILLVTSTVFGLFHVAGTSSGGAAVLVFCQIFLVGLTLAHVTLKHQRLGPAIFMHAGFNLLTSIILLLPPEVIEQLEQAGM